jgi:hypothetical protein
MSESNTQYNKRQLKRAIMNAYLHWDMERAVETAIDCAYEMAAMNMALAEADTPIQALTDRDLELLITNVAMRRLPQPPPETAPRHQEEKW